MQFTQNSFANFLNNDIVDFINEINNGLNKNLEIADTHRYYGGARLRNVRTLMNYLSQYNAQQIIEPNFNDNEFDEKLNEFIIHELERSEQLLNESHEHNYNNNIANRESFYEDEFDESDYYYFNEQHQINQEFYDKKFVMIIILSTTLSRTNTKKTNSLDEFARINSQNKLIIN